MVIADSSGSMTTAVGVGNSCGYPSDRLGHMRCAIKNTLPTFDGKANFGLATYARRMTGCPAGACAAGMGSCTFTNLAGDAAGTTCSSGCGPERVSP